MGVRSTGRKSLTVIIFIVVDRTGRRQFASADGWPLAIGISGRASPAGLTYDVMRPIMKR
jgi:hypothetical protein